MCYVALIEMRDYSVFYWTSVVNCRCGGCESSRCVIVSICPSSATPLLKYSITIGLTMPVQTDLFFFYSTKNSIFSTKLKTVKLFREIEQNENPVVMADPSRGKQAIG